MLYMPPHKMMSLGATVSGTVAASYDPLWLCDGDPAFPVRTTGGSASFVITGTSTAGINGIVLANTNLVAATNVVFTGAVAGTVVAPTVPPSGVRFNAMLAITPVTASSSTLTIASHATPIVIGECFIGVFLDAETLPPESDSGEGMFELPTTGEFGGLSQDRGAKARRFGGTIYCTDAQKTALDDWFDACRNNSLASVIVPFVDILDPWVVLWESYEPRPIMIDLWVIHVAWKELPRYRWP